MAGAVEAHPVDGAMKYRDSGGRGAVSPCGPQVYARPPPPGGWAKARSVRLDAEVVDDLAVFLVVLMDQRAELRRRQDQRLEAAGDVELLGKVRPGEQLVDFRAQRGEDRLRRSRRCENAEPDVDREAWVELADGGQVRIALRALLAAGGEHAQLPARDQRRARRAREQHLGVAGDGRLRRRRRAAERHVQEVDAGALLEDLHG